MTDYTIWIVSPKDYPHSACFNEVAAALKSGLITLGHTATIVSSTNHPAKFNTIILGANLLKGYHGKGRADTIFNLEQISPGSPWITTEYINILGAVEHLWDYSQKNITALANLGISAKLCEIGYAKELENVEHKPYGEKDIDVLFYGSINDRRQEILDKLQKVGVRVTAAFGIYGVELDKLLARAKVVLNMHFYDSKVFEIVRCSYAMANNCAIVSETGSDSELQEPFLEGIAFAPYEQLVGTCVMMLNNEGERLRIAKNGYMLFKNRPQSVMLKRLVGEVTNVG